MHSTNNLNDGYIGSGKKLWFSIKKYGKENFKFEILEFLPDRTSLKNREKEIVNNELLVDLLCMNLKIGGEGGGRLWSDEHAKSLHKGSSEFQKGKWKIPEYRTKITEMLRQNMINNHKAGKIKHDTFRNKKHTEEAKQKISKKNSINQKGEKNSQYGTCWITNGNISKKIKREDANVFIHNGWNFGRL